LDKNKKVMVLMSGGVDSSVAAALVQKQGYEVFGATMKIWAGIPAAGKTLHHGCYGPEEEADIEDARRVADFLGIPYRVIDLTQEYQNIVLDYFSQEYACGRTPNPCVRCNHRVKFGALIDKAREAGLEFDFIASGHYARVEYKNNRYMLKKARDLMKDQSYFLSFLTQQQLSRLMFPLGELTKSEVRQIAADMGLQTAEKPDSQNFISGDYSSVIQMNSKPGPILNKEGKVLGQHKGIQNYTIGQRKGLEIGTSEPLYVSAIDPIQNTIVVGEKKDLYRQTFTVSDLNWISITDLEKSLTLNVKIRSSQKEVEAEVSPLESRKFKVEFKEPQTAITPGQTAVFYDKETVVGGGIIE
jgi:tRNA-uridine 2-sulfurtransferase